MLKQGFQGAEATQGHTGVRRGIEKLAQVLAVMVSTAGAATAQPTSNGLQLWLRADAGVESAPGTPAAAGDAVSGWLDQSGNSRHLTQADAGARPLLQATGLNGAATLRFDGSNDWLFGSAIPLLGSSDLTIFAVAAGANLAGLGNGEGAIFADAGWTGAVLEREAGSFRYWSNYQRGKGQPEVVSGGVLPGTGFSARIFTVQRDVGISVALGMDGTTVAVANGGGVIQSFTGGTLSVGGHNNLGAPISYTAWAGDIAEVLVYDSSLSAAQFNATGYYLEQKYGLDTNFLPVPEPGGWAMMLAGIWLVRRASLCRKGVPQGVPS